MEFPNFIVWFKLPSYEFRVYDYKKDELTTEDLLSKFSMNQFEFITKDVSKRNDENLILYAKQLISERKEILDSNELLQSFDWFDNNLKIHDKTFYRNHSNNVNTFIKRLIPQDYKQFENILPYEESYYLKTNRGGLMYGLVGVYDIYTYDMKLFYGSIMGEDYNFYFPTCQGKIITIKKIPKKFEYGIYNIEITSNDLNFNKVFSFSKDNHYTHFSLNFVLYYNENYKGKIELNILSYDVLSYKDCLIRSKTIFNTWYKTLYKLKKEFPKNKLIKKLGSSGWGELSAYNTIIKTDAQIETEKLNIGFDFDDDYYIHKWSVKKDDTEIYHLVDLTKKESLYKHNFRLKSFITDYGRCKMAKIALQNINDVVRIQTDSISYKRNIKPIIENFILEEDKTGEFEILNSRRMIKI
jgi:hypothetical protein